MSENTDNLSDMLDADKEYQEILAKLGIDPAHVKKSYEFVDKNVDKNLPKDRTKAESMQYGAALLQAAVRMHMEGSDIEFTKESYSAFAGQMATEFARYCATHGDVGLK